MHGLSLAGSATGSMLASERVAFRSLRGDAGWAVARQVAVTQQADGPTNPSASAFCLLLCLGTTSREGSAAALAPALLLAVLVGLDVSDAHVDVLVNNAG